MSGYKIKIEPYLLWVKAKYHDHFFDLDDIHGESALKLFRRFFTRNNGRIIRDDEAGTTLSIYNDRVWRPRDQRCVYGSIEKGQFGVGEALFDINAEIPAGYKDRFHTGNRPQCFYIYIPPASTYGFAMLQKYGTVGIKTELYSLFRDYFDEVFQVVQENIPMLLMQPVYSRDEARRFMQGSVRQLILRRHGLDRDRFRQYSIWPTEQGSMNVEVRISPNRGFFNFFGNIDNFLDNPKGNLLAIEGMEDLGIDGDAEVLAETVHQGKRRLVDIDGFGRFQPSYDIHDEIRRNEENHPDVRHYRKIAHRIASDLYQELIQKQQQ